MRKSLLQNLSCKIPTFSIIVPNVTTLTTRSKLTTNHLAANIIAGAVMGLLTVTSAVSYSTVIFAGAFESALPTGIGLVLFASVVVSVIFTSLSSYRAIVATIAESTVPILILIAQQVASAMPNATSDAKLYTLIAVLIINSVINGILFLGLGRFKLGEFIRFIPYPVIGGFLASIGALLAIGSFQAVSGFDGQAVTVATLFQPNLLLQWLPAIIFAGIMFLVPQRIEHFLVVPGIIVGAIILFYLGLAITGTPIAAASAQGILLGSIPATGLYQFPTLQALTQADWSVVFRQLPTLAALWLTATIALLLNANGVELTIKRDLDLNQELKAAGIAAIASGLGGGVVGFPSAGENALTHGLGANNRLPAWIIAACCLVMLIGGAPLLTLFPKFILIGIPLVVTVEFFHEWLYQAWFKFSHSDYAIIVLIVLITVSVGYLQGIAVGLIAAIVLFVVNYSRLTVIRRISTGTYRYSNVLRTDSELEILQAEGDRIYILELQGLIFFGTANKLLNRIRDRLHLDSEKPIEFVILDFRLVSDLDASAVLSFTKLQQIAIQSQVHLVYTHLSATAHQRLQSGDCLEPTDSFCHVFADLDRGLEWCEQQILQMHILQMHALNQSPVSLEEQPPAKALAATLVADSFDPQQVDRLLACLEIRQLAEGEYLFRQGDPFDGLYFVGSGQVSVVLELGGGQTKRIRTYTVGNSIGEMGLYRRTVRMASVIADKASTLYFLSAATFENIEDCEPVLASEIHRFIVNLLAERLQHREQELQNLLESSEA